MLGQAVPPITLSQAVDMGLAQSKQLQATQARADMAQARSEQAKNALLPTISLAGGYTRLSDNITPFQVPLGPNGDLRALNPQILNQYILRASVQYSVFNGFRAIYTLRSTELLEQAAGLDIAKDRTEIAYTIVNACYNFYKLRQSRNILVESAKVADERVTQTKNLAQEGMALDNDVLKATINRDGLQQSLVEMDNAVATAGYNLGLMLGLAPGTPIMLDERSLFAIREANTAPWV